MGRFSDKKPEDPKEMSIKLPGLLHQRLSRMAKTEGRSLKKQIPRCLEEAITRWEAIKGIEGGAINQTMGKQSSAPQDYRLREVENPPLRKIAQSREKKRG